MPLGTAAILTSILGAVASGVVGQALSGGRKDSAPAAAPAPAPAPAALEVKPPAPIPVSPNVDPKQRKRAEQNVLAAGLMGSALSREGTILGGGTSTLG